MTSHAEDEGVEVPVIREGDVQEEEEASAGQQHAGHTRSDATQQYVSAGELQAHFASLIQGMHTSLAMTLAENRGQGGRYMTPPIFQDGDDPELFWRKFENCAEANGWS